MPDPINSECATARRLMLGQLSGMSAMRLARMMRGVAVEQIVADKLETLEILMSEPIEHTPEYIDKCNASRIQGPFWIWSKEEIEEMATGPADWDFDHWVGYLNAHGCLELHCFDAEGNLCSSRGFPSCLYHQAYVINRLPAAMRPALSKEAIRYSMGNAAKAGYVRLYDNWKRKDVTMRNGRAVRFLCPELNDEQVKNLAAEIRSEQVELGLSFTRDPYEVRKAYMNGPHSCMSYEFDFLYDDATDVRVHPTDVYWHPENDLALAIVKGGDRVLGRCIVRTGEKVFHRNAIYASNDYVSGMAEVMERMLQELGYESVHDDCWLEGVKLRRIDCNGGIVCPYLDPSNRCVEVHQDHLLVTEYGEHEVTHINACLKAYPPEHADVCSFCEELGHVAEYYSLHIGESVRLCESCYHGYVVAECADSGAEGICLSGYVELTDGTRMYIRDGWGEVACIDSGTSAGEYDLCDNTIMCSDSGNVYSVDDCSIYVDSDGRVWPKDSTVLVDGNLECRDDVDFSLYEAVTGEHTDYDSDYEDIPQYVYYKEQSNEEAS